MAQQFSSIFSMGPSQKGFDQSEENTLNAQAVEGTAENYSQAAKAVNEQTAGWRMPAGKLISFSWGS